MTKKPLLAITARMTEVVWFPKWLTQQREKHKRSLLRASANVRTRMRRLIRRRRKPAAKGQPPSAHVAGGGGLKAIVFAYDEQNNSSVIGPLRFDTGINPPLPGALQRGQTVKTRRATGRREKRIQRLEAHPFADVALNQAVDDGDVLKEFIG